MTIDVMTIDEKVFACAKSNGKEIMVNSSLENIRDNKLRKLGI